MASRHSNQAQPAVGTTTRSNCAFHGKTPPRNLRPDFHRPRRNSAGPHAGTVQPVGNRQGRRTLEVVDAFLNVLLNRMDLVSGIMAAMANRAYLSVWTAG